MCIYHRLDIGFFLQNFSCLFNPPKSDKQPHYSSQSDSTSRHVLGRITFGHHFLQAVYSSLGSQSNRLELVSTQALMLVIVYEAQVSSLYPRPSWSSQ